MSEISDYNIGFKELQYQSSSNNDSICDGRNVSVMYDEPLVYGKRLLTFI